MLSSSQVRTLKRLRHLADAGIRLFSSNGYERSQMSDVARLMGVAVGTLYLAVESKEALFDFLVRYTTNGSPDDWLASLALPMRTPAPGATLEYLTAAFAEQRWPVLEQALAHERADDPREEVMAILAELYAVMQRHRTGLVLVKSSMHDFPGLTDAFTFGLRARLLDRIAEYLRARAAIGQLHPGPDGFATAVVITQTISWAVLQRPIDPGFVAMDDDLVRTSVIGLLARGLLHGDPAPTSRGHRDG
jgi:AcrR family transcriptional regulator